MGEEMFRNALRRNRIYWAFTIITSLLMYGFTLTHFSIGVDDESFYRFFFKGDFLAQGRWGGHVTKYIFNSYEFLPFWRDFIAVVLIVIGITLWGYLIQKKSNNYFNNSSVVVFSCVAISCPFFVDNFIFMMTTVEMGLVLCLTAISLNLFVESVEHNDFVKKGIPIVLITTLGLAFSELTVVYFLIGIFIMLFISLFSSVKELKIKEITNTVVKGIIVIVLSLLLNSLIKFTLQMIYGVIPSDYTLRQIVYDFGSLKGLYSSLQMSFLSILNSYLSGKHIGPWITFLLSIVFFIYSLYLSIRRRKITYVLLCLGCIMAAYSMYFITGNENLAKRVFITNSIYNAFLVSLLFVFLQKTFNLSIIKKLSVILVVILVFYQSKYVNQVFFVDYLRYQYDVEKMHRIAEEVTKVQNGRHKGLVFIGKPEDYNLKIGEVEGYSIFQWDRFAGPQSEFKSDRIFRFMNMHGYFFEEKDVFDRQSVIDQSRDMPSYPLEGFVKDEEDYIIVKIGEAPYQMKKYTGQDFKKDYENNSVELIGNADFFSYHNNLLTVYGWGIKSGIDSGNIKKQVALVNNERQYFLKTDSIFRTDVNDQFNDGTDYRYSGYSVSSLSTEGFISGDYEIILIFDSGIKEYISLGKTIHVQ